MEIKTYTNIWNEEKKLYSIYEWQLPTPVGFRQIGLFFIGGIIWIPLMFFLGTPIDSSIGFIIWFGPPVALAILGNRPIFEDKTLIQYVQSNIGHMMEPKNILDGNPVNLKEEKFANKATPDPEPHHLEVNVWKKKELKNEGIS